MSYLNSMKATEDILTLLESWDAENKEGLESTAPIGENKGDVDPFGTVSLDDIKDTVEPNDMAFEPDNLIADKTIELSDAEKSIIREHLSEMLSELKGDDISEPALEMIIEEVAKNSTFLTEADENNFETPVEKSQAKDAKVAAAETYIRELLQIASENGGTLPEETPDPEVTDEPASTEEPKEPKEEKEEEKSEEKTEEKTEEKAEEKTESVETEKSEIVESEVVTTTEASVEETKEPVEEGVCTECGEPEASEIVEVPESDVIKVVDDSEVEPVDVTSVDSVDADDAKYATKEDVNEIKEMLQSFIGKTAAVFESAGLIKGTDAITSIEGKDPSMGKPSHSSAQKIIAPKIDKPGFKIATLRNLTDKPTKAESNAPFGKENEAATAKAAPSFKKGDKDHGKSTNTPEGGIPANVTPKKAKETPKPTDPVKAAVVRESVTGNPAKSWLAEAARLIRNGK